MEKDVAAAEKERDRPLVDSGAVRLVDFSNALMSLSSVFGTIGTCFLFACPEDVTQSRIIVAPMKSRINVWLRKDQTLSVLPRFTRHARNVSRPRDFLRLRL